MSGRSLRLRVALAAAAGVLLAVVALAVAAQEVVGHELRAAQDRGLRERATAVARLSVTAPALLTSAGALDAPSGGQDLLVEVLDARRRIVARSSNLGGRLLPARALVDRAIRRGRTGSAGGELTGVPLRLFAAPLPAAGGLAGGGAVVVASSTRESDRTAARVRSLILLSALLAAAVGAAAAAALTGRGLAPLRRLTLAAREIQRTGDAARRLPPAAGREVGALTRTLNDMLAALERARTGERRFLADASHELRTPVTALRGNVEYLVRHGADADALADVRADAERLARLVDDLLVLERQAHVAARDVVALDEVARAVAAAHGDRVGVAAAPVAVVGDADALGRAVENLVANAVAHGHGAVAVTVAAHGDRARLSVADEGPGLTEEQAASAFERFWRGPGSAARAGSGLGLAIVRATARAHGGDVAVDGATFTLDLPLAGGGARSSETPQSRGVPSGPPPDRPTLDRSCCVASPPPASSS